MNKKEDIRKIAHKNALDIVRFTDGVASDFLEETLTKRIEENKITEFESREIQEKIDLKSSFPWYKSVIVVGKSYLNDYREKVDFNKGLLSKSTYGLDYHKVLKRDMEKFIEELKKKYNGRYESYVDTGPLVDRNLAYTSGLGYYGKNCSIINDEYGSFIFIGYIVTSLDLKKDIKVENKCGECIKCLNKCPTGALEAPFKINPKKCISYLTQTKEDIPYYLRDKMGSSIYGCDICQLVCPKNIGVKVPNHDDFLPLKTKGFVDIDEILSMTNKSFKEKYGDMSGAWRGKNILKRNAIIALGNKKNKDYIGLLENLLDDDSKMIRKYALYSFIKLEPEVNIKKIESKVIRLKDPDMMEEFEKIKEYLL